MFSIRKPAAMLFMVGVGMLAGCQVQMQPHTATDGNLNTKPIATDQAMDKRQWDNSASYYANDGVFAHPFYGPLVTEAQRYYLNAFSDSVLFLADLAYLPVGVFIEYPWTFQVNKSVTAPPSYTLMPALPDGPEPVPTY
jgi:hypothetical protein